MTHRAPTKLPPQKWKPAELCNETWNGYCRGVVSRPPTMRELVVPAAHGTALPVMLPRALLLLPSLPLPLSPPA